MSLEIYQSAFTAHQLESAIAGGRAPWADGLTEFPLEAYTVSGADMTALASAIAEKAGATVPAFPQGWQEAVEEVQKLYYSSNGAAYPSQIITPDTVTAYAAMHGDCPELVRIDLNKAASASYPAFHGSYPKLKEVLAPNLKALGRHFWCSNANIENMQVGSIGVPVTSADSIALRGVVSVVLTIYVDASALSEIPDGIINNSPFGCSNATIIYRNSTTGEVITE